MQKVRQTNNGRVSFWIVQQLLIVGHRLFRIVDSLELGTPGFINIRAGMDVRVIQSLGRDGLLLARPTGADDAKVNLLHVITSSPLRKHHAIMAKCMHVGGYPSSSG